MGSLHGKETNGLAVSFFTGISLHIRSLLLLLCGLEALEPTQAAISAAREPAIASVVAYFWWGECFTLQGYTGSALNLGSVIFMITAGARRPGK
jgi:DME family drug/metabolite transporter